MSPELSAKRISDYLTTGFHHNTDEAQEVIANIIRDSQECLTNNLHLASEGERYAMAQLSKIKILALRNYPELKRSGLCSKHREDGHYECSICYINYLELLEAHAKVSEQLYDELLKLSGLSDPDNGRIGTNAIVNELRKQLNKQ